MRVSHGLSARRAWRTKSRGLKGLQLEVAARRAPRLLACEYLEILIPIFLIYAMQHANVNEWAGASSVNICIQTAPRSRPEKHKTNSIDWLDLEAWTSRFSGYPLSDSIKGSVLPLHRLVPMAVLLWCSRVEKVIPNNFLGSKYCSSFKFPLYPTHLSLVVRFLVWRKLTLFTQHRNSMMNKHQVYQYNTKVSINPFASMAISD